MPSDWQRHGSTYDPRESSEPAYIQMDESDWPSHFPLKENAVPPPDPTLDKFPMMSVGYVQTCPECGDEHHPPTDRIVTENGVYYDDPLRSPPEVAWWHPRCWARRRARERAGENRSLAEFVD